MSLPFKFSSRCRRRKRRSRPSWRPAASAPHFAPAATRVRPPCGLPLGAIIQGGSLPALLWSTYLPTCLPARQLDCLLVRAYVCMRARARVRAVVCLGAGTSQSRSLSLLPPLTHSVLVVAYACCSIHKSIETCGGTSATLHVGVENRRRACNTMRTCTGAISAITSTCLFRWIFTCEFDRKCFILTEYRYFQSHLLYRVLYIFLFYRLYLFLLYSLRAFLLCHD